MTEKELNKIISQKYSEETANQFANEQKEYFADENCWDNYCQAVIELMNKNYSEDEFIDYAFVLPRKHGRMLVDD